MGITDKTPIAERYAKRYSELDVWLNGPNAPTDEMPWQMSLPSERRMIEELSAAEQRVRVLRDALGNALAANERDRTVLHRAVSAIDEEITGRMWLMEGRGCYEWDDGRYRQEFGWAIGAIRKNIEVLRKIAGDLSNCPTTQKDVDAARAALASAQGKEQP